MLHLSSGMMQMELEREICSMTENGWHVVCKTGEHIRRKGTGKLVQVAVDQLEVLR